MSRSLLPLSAVFVLAAAMPAGAWAQNALSALDANDDGAISRQEAIDGQRKTFERLDGNGDGLLDTDEFAAGQPGRDSEELPADVRRARRASIERQFAILDRDDDGAISLAEYQAAMTPYFDALDTNSDGVLDGAELRQAIEDDSPRD
ncbi:EF-hand domain-containing protein [Salinisphaera sp. C84B14]|uniref:EF-hand domain-containing protein n=1 Tax=Salinisphaera sp. C84B14 TaxID=1304155 RepID=UPI00333F4090